MNCKKRIDYITNLFYNKPGHYKYHAIQTAIIAQEIARSINYPQHKAWIAGMLHDIGLILNRKHHATIGAHLTKLIILLFCPQLKKDIQEFYYAIKWHNRISFAPYKSTLLKILVDADTLELLGTIGVIRAIQDNYKIKNIIIGNERDYDYNHYNGKITNKERNISSILQLLIFLKDTAALLHFQYSRQLATTKLKHLETIINSLKTETKFYKDKVIKP